MKIYLINWYQNPYDYDDAILLFLDEKNAKEALSLLSENQHSWNKENPDCFIKTCEGYCAFELVERDTED